MEFIKTEHPIEQMRILDLRSEPQHINLLSVWHHRQWSHLNPEHRIKHRAKLMEEYLTPQFIPTMFIAKSPDLIGSAAIVKQDMPSYPELSPWLANVYVKPEHRNKGVGRQLVNHVVEQALNHNIHRLYLFTPDHCEFYLQLGWKILEITHYQNSHVTIMFKDLLATKFSSPLYPHD